jgi:drug/metabolite transporter (DMT)-like permease
MNSTPPPIDSKYPLSPVTMALLLATVVGVSVHAFKGFYSQGAQSAKIALVAWACTPYLVALLTVCFTKHRKIPLGFALGSLVGTFYEYFTSSPDAYGSWETFDLLVRPIWSLLLLGPIGAFLAWCITSGHGSRRPID